MSGDQKTKYSLPSTDMGPEFESKLSSVIHEVTKSVWGGNFVSPIEQDLTNKKNFKVLDVGCGRTYVWLLELSKKYPSAKFIGLDLFSLSPPKDFSQDNLQFVQGDIIKGLPFEDGSIDFVHMRCVLASFTERQWEEIVIKELVRICKPGGWIELSEIDADGKSLGPTSKRLLTACITKLESNGINGLITEDIPEFFESTNQVEVYAEEKYSPIGSWGDDSGRLALEFFLTIYNGSGDLMDYIGVNKEEYENMINQFIEEVDRYRSYFIPLKFFCQKFTS
ncbi:hypothetical protein RclHR1_26430002 [Rhizophagus clarus]|uniref:S-adenosyl-L-methionine-dependent methyltransferase n=1 Tax=Rhizophagus clarus TaxID=94130 RepID=A0A2Z6RVB4_9GLOM|nr:hypothetical protein RclHR1_26430002 [Rhizophagus clarus]GES87405.1 S-adenosyl-L-methionine-dependent methyltransferase [Rhizophagus clarus]